MAGVVGRDAELSAIRAFVGSISEGAAALVLEGEAGMGKTTLWSASVANAQEQGVFVLQARPAESEITLSFCALGDVLQPVLEESLARLPDGQKRALARALVLDDAEGPPPDPHAVGVALLNALRGLAETRPLLVAVDDVHWLDPASAGALAYAVRRLRDEHVGVLFAQRTALESMVLDEVVRCLPAGRVLRVDVGPLGIAELNGVVQQHLGRALPRPLLAEVREASGGNPFYALEIVRMLRRTGISVEAGHPLPVPESLHDLVHSRLLALPSESREYLLAAAAHAHPTTSVVEAASGVGPSQGLTPALEAGVVKLDGDRIHFTHPLLAAGAYQTADVDRRRAVHARLAELLDDPEARAWQLAASVVQPDEGVAAVLEEAAQHARVRGAPRPAALLLDRASELTPAEARDDMLRRVVDAAFRHYESGDSPRAEAQLRDVVAELAPGRTRARALVRLARVRAYEAVDEAVDLFLQAVDEAEGDQALLAVAHEGVAFCLWRLYERLEEAVEHADLAAELALELGDKALAGEALGTRLVAELLLGRESAPATAALSLTLQPAAEHHRVLAQPRSSIAMDYLGWSGELERARDQMIELLLRASELGDESSPPFVLGHLSIVECELGALERARARALEGKEAADQAGQRAVFAFNLAIEGLVEAHCGNEDRARTAALGALELVAETAGRQAELIATHALGHLELVLGNAREAVERIEPMLDYLRQESIVEPSAIRVVVDYVEALIDLGRREEAVELLDWYEGNARRLERESALAACLRCRGLLAAQAGSVDEALAAYEQALELHAQSLLPLDRARTLLALGAAQRRAKRRREARATLEEALGAFERIGAALWAERARGELQRISGRAATPGALTPSEQRVAALVAEGKTNREVAAALFLSERTVEGHLSHAFGKLGVRSRTELARVLGATGREVTASNTGDSPVSGDSAAL
jgi:DNA-binding CsgD family transcriptional regulator